MIHPVKSVKSHIRRNRNKYASVAAVTTFSAGYAVYCIVGWKELLTDPEAFNAKHPA